jgi:hypothetical protein
MILGSVLNPSAAAARGEPFRYMYHATIRPGPLTNKAECAIVGMRIAHESMRDIWPLTRDTGCGVISRDGTDIH